MRRILRATKNRFGPVDELALYEMTGEGLSEIANASAALLAERRTGQPAAPSRRRARFSLPAGRSAALVRPAARLPRRRDRARRVKALLLAVLEGAGLALSTREVFVSCTEVSRSRRPPRILRSWRPVSSSRGQALPESTVFGEIGLLGEVRRVPAAEARLKEAAASASAAFLGGNAAMRPFQDHRDADRPRLRLPARGVPSFGRGVAEDSVGLEPERRG
jgi:DNA repair protein RadA/Sms